MYVLGFMEVASCDWINDCCNDQLQYPGGLNQIVWWLNMNHIGMSWWCNEESGEKFVLLGTISDSWFFIILHLDIEA